MSDGLNAARKKVYTAFTDRSSTTLRAARYVKIGVALVGAFLLALASVVPNWSWFPPSPWLVAGVIGALMVFGAGVFIVLTEEDATSALDAARTAIDHATDSEEYIKEVEAAFPIYARSITSLRYLYIAMSAARGFFEQYIFGDDISEDLFLQLLMEHIKRPIRIALGFELDEYWTIVVYKAYYRDKEKRTYLRCVAHHRSNDCDIKNAREWPEGLGVCGVAYAKNDEVGVPDLRDPAVGTAFRLDKTVLKDGEKLLKDGDLDSYRSLFAVAVSVGTDERPWGVVVATSNKPHHFMGPDTPGVEPEEAVRALAGLVALAVSISRGKLSGKGGNPSADSTIQE